MQTVAKYQKIGNLKIKGCKIKNMCYNEKASFKE
nr:MAG TPA: hypothetical protein [Caudoviricetes sp.]